jgi:hypothetical protein
MSAIDAELVRHDHGIPLPDERVDDPDADLIRRLQRSRAKTLALTADPDADHVAHLARTTRLADLEAAAAAAHIAEGRATAITGVDPVDSQARCTRAAHTATHAAPGALVKAHDRHNVGTIDTVNDEAGTALVRFRAANGSESMKELPWETLEVLRSDAPARETLPAAAQGALDLIVGDHRDGLARWEAAAAAGGAARGDADRYSRAAVVAIDRAADRLAAERPAWLTTALGERPTSSSAVRVWNDAVRDIAAHRERAGLTDEVEGLGPEPDDHDLSVRRDHVGQRVTDAGAWLADHQEPVAAVARRRTPSELEDRRAELDALLAGAPADQRDLLAKLRDIQQLPYDDLPQLLQETVRDAGERSAWITANWPHVVEAAEVEAATCDDEHGLGLD